jgi:hypothetical protein
LPEPVAGGDNLPNAGAGPFRALVEAELSAITLSLSAPFGLDDGRSYARDIAVLRADDQPDSLAVVAYVAAAAGSSSTSTTPTSRVVRYSALDGRSFDYRDTSVVLTADAPWEGGAMGAPTAVRVGGTFLLYYAAAGGIGLAKSPDGMTFSKVLGPVLAPAAGGWEKGAAPASPGVIALADGSLRMFYEVAIAPFVTAIGEASSHDGVTWTRVGAGPALAPSGGDADGGSDAPDAASVGSPFPVLATSADNRLVLRLYYGARDATGAGTIGLAARYGTEGPFQRAVGPVFGAGTTLGPREPCVVPFQAATLLYVTESDSTLGGHPAIAIGVAPATAVLAPPNPR